MDEIMNELENMTEQELQQLLDADFGDELEKQAEAELSQADLAEALYAYGAHVATCELLEGQELSKEASAEVEEDYEAITQAIEDNLLASGILNNEDTAELHKEAQAAAGIIFKGYSDQLEKAAASASDFMTEAEAKDAPTHAHPNKAKPSSATKTERMKAWLSSAGGKIAKNKKALGLGAAGAVGLGAGAYAYKKRHEKKASEVTASEMAEIIAEDQWINEVISTGLQKLANDAELSGAELDKKIKASKELERKHKLEGSYGKKGSLKRFALKNMSTIKTVGKGAAIGLGAAGAGYGAMKLRDKLKKKKD
jgi:hypothetical protein